MLKGRKNSGASKGYKSTTEMLTGYGKKPRTVRIKTTTKKPKLKKTYKIPTTPKVSGLKWR